MDTERCGPASFARNPNQAFRIFDQLKSKLSEDPLSHRFELFALRQFLALPISPELAAQTAHQPIRITTARRAVIDLLATLPADDQQDLSESA